MLRDIPFHQEYERLCYKYRGFLNGIGIQVGSTVRMPDSMIDLAKKTGNDYYTEAFLIPSLEELYHLLEEQIRFCQDTDVPRASILLFFDPPSDWLLEVEFVNGKVFHGLARSPHGAYLECIYRMSLDPQPKR